MPGAIKALTVPHRTPIVDAEWGLADATFSGCFGLTSVCDL